MLFCSGKDASGAKGTESGAFIRKMESKRENRQHRKEAWRPYICLEENNEQKGTWCALEDGS